MDTDVSLAAQLDLTAYHMEQTPTAYRMEQIPDLSTALVTLGNTALFTPLPGHTGSVTAVVFSPDGRTLATGSADRTVRLWNVTDLAHPSLLGEPLAGHTGSVTAVVFSPDGRTLATGSAHSTVRLLDLNLDHAIQRICAITAHTLTKDFDASGAALAGR